jgi:hypothetical protein
MYAKFIVPQPQTFNPLSKWIDKTSFRSPLTYYNVFTFSILGTKILGGYFLLPQISSLKSEVLFGNSNQLTAFQYWYIPDP